MAAARVRNPSHGSLASAGEEKHTTDANRIAAGHMFLVGDNALDLPDDQIERLRAVAEFCEVSSLRASDDLEYAELPTSLSPVNRRD
jgi:hypothetical protein